MLPGSRIIFIFRRISDQLSPQIPSTSLFLGVEWQLPLPLVPKLTLTSARRQHPRTPHPPLHEGLTSPRAPHRRRPQPKYLFVHIVIERI